MNIFEYHQKKTDKALGKDMGEVGKKWDDTFEKGDMSQAQFQRPEWRDRKPPAEILKKHMEK